MVYSYGLVAFNSKEEGGEKLEATTGREESMIMSPLDPEYLGFVSVFRGPPGSLRNRQ